jgi:Tat protein secretion system quality control protein TatD with DNase activity
MGERRQLGREDSREAKETCDIIMQAAQLVAIKEHLEVITQESVSQAIQRTWLTKNYLLKVIPPDPPEATSYVAHDDKVIENSPKEFIATELRSIGEHGVEFYNSETEQRLQINGYDFDLEPVLPGDL